jgi:hypothetical protein
MARDWKNISSLRPGTSSTSLPICLIYPTIPAIRRAALRSLHARILTSKRALYCCPSLTRFTDKTGFGCERNSSPKAGRLRRAVRSPRTSGRQHGIASYWLTESYLAFFGRTDRAGHRTILPWHHDFHRHALYRSDSGARRHSAWPRHPRNVRRFAIGSLVWIWRVRPDYQPRPPAPQY